MRTPDLSTDQLVRDATAGDPAALDELLVRYLPELQAFLRFELGDKLAARESVSDLAQSVCRDVLQQLSGFEYRGESAFKRWLFLHARRKLVARARYHNRERRDIGREQPLAWDEALSLGAANLLTPSRDAMAKEELHVLARCIDQLPEEQRRALTLCRGLGMSPSEAAAELGKSANAVRVALHRGLARLSVMLDAAGGDGRAADQGAESTSS